MKTAAELFSELNDLDEHLTVSACDLSPPVLQSDRTDNSFLALPGKLSALPGELSALPGELTTHPRDLMAEQVGLPADLRQEIESLGKRAALESVKRVIRLLCAWQDLPLETLASLLGRSQTYLQDQYLTQMVRDGDLEFTIPEKPTDPKQAYRTPRQPPSTKADRLSRQTPSSSE